MRLDWPTRPLLRCAIVAASAITLGAQYSLTVTKDRLINAQNE